MKYRRLVGIDLGIASAHTVRVLDEDGETLTKRKAWPTVESLTEIETAALADTPTGTRLEVVVEPTGPAWLPIAVFFVNGQWDLPGGGQWFCPVVANRTARGWPVVLPGVIRRGASPPCRWWLG